MSAKRQDSAKLSAQLRQYSLVSGQDTFDRARNYAYRLLTYRPRSQREIVDKLTRRGFDGETTNAVVNYLKQLNYINDFEFARTWVERRISAKPMGLSLLRQELRSKGIRNEIIEEVIDIVNKDYDEYRLAKDLFSSRWQKYSHLDRVTSQRRIYAYLKRRGFSSEVISKLMQEETT